MGVWKEADYKAVLWTGVLEAVPHHEAVQQQQQLREAHPREGSQNMSVTGGWECFF